jgi:hypothetical protein
VSDRRPGRVAEVVSSFGSKAVALDPDRSEPADARWRCWPPTGRTQVAEARELRAGRRPRRHHHGLGARRAAAARPRARGRGAGGFHRGRGATFSPGLTCVLARLASDRLDTVDEIHVVSARDGGPDLRPPAPQGARRRRDRLARRRLAAASPPGSGRELSWFPDPIGAADCYRAEPCPTRSCSCRPSVGVGRVTARLAATRRDRLTSRLPMLRPPASRGGAGSGAGRGAGP